MSEWMPIETAPKDGTLYLATDGDGFEVLNQPPQHYPGVWRFDQRRQRWSGGITGSAYEHTHWTPLPQPPKESE